MQSIWVQSIATVATHAHGTLRRMFVRQSIDSTASPTGILLQAALEQQVSPCSMKTTRASKNTACDKRVAFLDIYWNLRRVDSSRGESKIA